LENQAIIFWGYIDKAFSVAGYEEEFAELVISGLKHFLNKDTIENAEKKMREEYTKKIDELYQENILVATYLLRNKDSMVGSCLKSVELCYFCILRHH
jgi:hypothetical protein